MNVNEQIVSSRIYAGLEINRIWGSAMENIDYPDGIDGDQRFFIAAAAAGITTPVGLYNYYYKETKEGKTHNLDWMTKRLVRVNELSVYAWKLADELNPVLAGQLRDSKTRKNDPGRSDSEFVSSKNSGEISPTSTPTGWAIPRILILLEEKHKTKLGQGNPGEKLLKETIQESVVSTEEDKEILPPLFLCKLSEKLFVQEKIPADDLIKLMLKDEILQDQNNLDMYLKIIELMGENSPKLLETVREKYDMRNELSKVPGWMNIFSKSAASGR